MAYRTFLDAVLSLFRRKFALYNTDNSVISTYGRRNLQPDLVTELVNAHDLVNGLALLPADSDLITGDNIPVFYTVLWFCGLDNGVPEGHPPLPMAIIREEMTESFGVWAGRPSLKNFLPSEHFGGRHCGLIVRRRVRTAGSAQTVADSRNSC